MAQTMQSVHSLADSSLICSVFSSSNILNECLVRLFQHTDLSQYMEKHSGGLDHRNVRLFLFQLLRGLAYCHRRRVLHRDVNLRTFSSVRWENSNLQILVCCSFLLLFQSDQIMFPFTIYLFIYLPFIYLPSMYHYLFIWHYLFIYLQFIYLH